MAGGGSQVTFRPGSGNEGSVMAAWTFRGVKAGSVEGGGRELSYACCYGDNIK